MRVLGDGSTADLFHVASGLQNPARAPAILIWLQVKLASPPLPSDSAFEQTPCATAWKGFMLISAPPLP